MFLMHQLKYQAKYKNMQICQFDLWQVCLFCNFVTCNFCYFRNKKIAICQQV